MLKSVSTFVRSVNGDEATLADARGLSVGDYAIIESQHAYGEDGLDGNWPAMDRTVGYYWEVKNGRSFVSKVVAINGDTVKFDRPVPLAAVDHPVYRDNTADIIQHIESGAEWPYELVLHVATPAHYQNICPYLTHDDRLIDFRWCEIVAPRGCPALQLYVQHRYNPAVNPAWNGGWVNNKQIRNLILRGNVRNSGYGFQANSGMPAMLNVGGTNWDVSNVHCIDGWRDINIAWGSKNCTISNVLCRRTAQLKNYIQWSVLAHKCSDITIQDVVIDGDYALPAFEAFQSSRINFVRCGGRNAMFSNNSSTDILFKDCYCEWDDAWANPKVVSRSSPIININQTIDAQQTQAANEYATTIENFRMEYKRLPFFSACTRTVTCTPRSRTRINGMRYINPFSNADATAGNIGYVVSSDSKDIQVRGLVADKLDTGSPYAVQWKPREQESELPSAELMKIAAINALAKQISEISETN